LSTLTVISGTLNLGLGLHFRALGESASALRLGFLALILVGIIGLKMVEV
jgi:hypothetical protein